MNPLFPPQSPLLMKIRHQDPQGKSGHQDSPRQKLDTKTPPEPKVGHQEPSQGQKQTPRLPQAKIRHQDAPGKIRHQDPPGPKAETKTPPGKNWTPRPPAGKNQTPSPQGQKWTPRPPKAKTKGFQIQRSGKEGGSRGSFRTYEISRCRKGLTTMPAHMVVLRI